MNSFSNYGQIVTGDRFVTRDEHVTAIQERVTEAEVPGCLALVGMPRIGKSCLAYNAIIGQADHLMRRRVVPVWVDCGCCVGRDFFHVLIDRTYHEMDLAGAGSPKLTALYQSAVDAIDCVWPVLTQHIIRFFSEIRKSSWKIVLVLDEFDNARRIFERDSSGFHFLRELAYNPKWSVAYVTTSRRSIADIQGHCAISNLPGIFRHQIVGCFTESEAFIMTNKASEESCIETDLVRSLAQELAGRNPFALSSLLFKLVELGNRNLDTIAQRAREGVNYEFLQLYESQLIPHLRSEMNLGNLISILFGASIDVDPVIRSALKAKGLVDEVDGRWLPFSRHFGEFLEHFPFEPEEWPLWRKTEVSLRDAIDHVLIQEYGNGWLGTLVERPKLGNMLQDALKMMQREQESYGHRGSTRILDVMYPGDLFDILFSEWKMFAPWFKRDKAYWNQRKELIARVRNPLAHNRTDVLGLHEIALFRAYCCEVLDVCATIMRRDKNQSAESKRIT